MLGDARPEAFALFAVLNVVTAVCPECYKVAPYIKYRCCFLYCRILNIEYLSVCIIMCLHTMCIYIYRSTVTL